MTYKVDTLVPTLQFNREQIAYREVSAWRLLVVTVIRDA